MGFAILLVVFFWAVYVLLIKGVLWKLLLVIFGWFGLFVFLGIYFPSTAIHGIIVADTLVPWNAVLPSFVVLLSLAYTKENDI
jgi:hypothetical protein